METCMDGKHSWQMKWIYIWKLVESGDMKKGKNWCVHLMSAFFGKTFNYKMMKKNVHKIKSSLWYLTSVATMFLFCIEIYMRRHKKKMAKKHKNIEKYVKIMQTQLTYFFLCSIFYRSWFVQLNYRKCHVHKFTRSLSLFLYPFHRVWWKVCQANFKFIMNTTDQFVSNNNRKCLETMNWIL